MEAQQIRVLVIDDSAYNRQIISEIIASQPDMEVVGKADDGEQGLKLAAHLRPDLITLDIEMPRMDGYTFLRLLMSQLPTPVIVISSHSNRQEVFQALELGALDFVAKPQRYLQPELQSLREDIVRKVNAVRALQVIPFQRQVRAQAKSIDESAKPILGSHPPIELPLRRMICIGASTGGPPALQSIVKVMTRSTPTALLVAQHMPEKFTRAFAERLNRISALHVCEAEQDMPVRSGHAYIAPGGCHMEVVQSAAGPFIKLAGVSQEDRYTPSIDRLFESAAKLRGYELLAAVLTGMGADGSIGIRAVRAAGARTLAESQESAIVFGMPKEAIASRCIDEVLALDMIIERLVAFSSAGLANGA